MKLLDKIKLRLCGDFLSIASLKMQVEDLELENEELKQKNKTLSNNNNSYSKKWEDMFYKDWAEEIYQSEMKQELMEENTELYSQLQELAKVYEEMKQNYQEKLHLKNIKIIELESDNNTLKFFSKSFGKQVSNLLNENHNLDKENMELDNKSLYYIKEYKHQVSEKRKYWKEITELKNENDLLNTQLDNLQKDYDDIRRINSNDSKVYLWTEPYIDEKYGKEAGASFKYFQEFIKMPTPRNLVGFQKSLENQMSKTGRKRIPSYQTICEYSAKWKWTMRSKAYDEYLNKRSLHQNELQTELSKKYSKLKRDFDDLCADYDTSQKEIYDQSKKNKELQQRLSEKSKYIIQLKSEKDTLLKEDNSPVKRGDKQYNRFKQAVLKRDNYTCQCCGSTDAPEVHHQFPFVTYNHLGADTKNGIVLCKECHQKYHSKYGINGHTNNPVTFAQFLRDEGKVMQSTLEDNSYQPLTFDSAFTPTKNRYESIMEYIESNIE